MFNQIHEISDDPELYKLEVMNTKDDIIIEAVDCFNGENIKLTLTYKELQKIMNMRQADEHEEIDLEMNYG